MFDNLDLEKSKLGLNYVPRGNHCCRKCAGAVRLRIYAKELGDGFRAAKAVQRYYGHSSLAITERYLPEIGGESSGVPAMHSGAIQIGNNLTEPQHLGNESASEAHQVTLGDAQHT